MKSDPNTREYRQSNRPDGSTQVPAGTLNPVEDVTATSGWDKARLTIADRWNQRYTDTAAILLLFILTIIFEWNRIVGGTSLGLDSATQFYPRFAFLGESLRSGNIPGWLPAQFSGAPFAGDPQSGWMYFLAMALFTLLPLGAAATAYVFLHLFLASAGAYWLARLLGMPFSGSMLAAIVYGFNSYIYERNVCCFTYTGITTWLPFAIIGAEMAIKSPGWLSRLSWCGLSGLAVSQLFGIWLGQGAYYGLIALGGYMLYRTVFDPPNQLRKIRDRVTILFTNGAIILAFGLGIGAAGVLPRLTYNSLSNLSGGYKNTQQAVIGGWDITNLGLLISRGQHGTYYAGGAVLVLALVAPIVARRKFGTAFWGILALATVILSGQGPTPLHWLLYHILPLFAHVHPHDPERIMMLFYLAIALMAGATVSNISRLKQKAIYLAILPGVGVLAMVAFEGYGPHLKRPLIPEATLLMVLVAITFFIVISLIGSRSGWKRTLSALLILAVCFDLYTADQYVIEHGPGHEEKVNLNQYYAAGDIANFLRRKSDSQIFRFFGYDPTMLATDPQTKPVSVLYRYQFADLETKELLVNNRATILGLQDIQGYDSIQIGQYSSLFNMLNGTTFDYRSQYVLGSGLRSPWIDLLNVRYIVIPSYTPLYLSGLLQLSHSYKSVFDSGYFTVLENPNALPRAWIVHSAREVPNGQALALITNGQVDPRTTALVEKLPVKLSGTKHPSSDSAKVTQYSPDKIVVNTNTNSPGLLMLSEIYYPAWKAYVDGKPVQLLQTDYALRSVPIPEGKHTVELRFESEPLNIGVIISSVSLAILATILLLRLVPDLRRRVPRLRRNSGD